MYRYILLCACILRAGTLLAQTDSSATGKDLREVVVTATRNEQPAGKVPIPVTVINKPQLRSMSVALLQQVLAGQTGLFITPDHGTGMQMQGLDAQYAHPAQRRAPDRPYRRYAGPSRIMVGK